ncbi:hypothetical protein Tco_0626521, partial [Tanacetum coccineum]
MAMPPMTTSRVMFGMSLRTTIKVKYIAGSFVGKALTWWNSQIHKRGREATIGMSWEDFKTLTRDGAWTKYVSDGPRLWLLRRPEVVRVVVRVGGGWRGSGDEGWFQLAAAGSGGTRWVMRGRWWVGGVEAAGMVMMAVGDGVRCGGVDGEC